jgi:hypothetical protein
MHFMTLYYKNLCNQLEQRLCILEEKVKISKGVSPPPVLIQDPEAQYEFENQEELEKYSKNVEKEMSNLPQSEDENSEPININVKIKQTPPAPTPKPFSFSPAMQAAGSLGTLGALATASAAAVPPVGAAALTVGAIGALGIEAMTPKYSNTPATKADYAKAAKDAASRMAARYGTSGNNK